MVKLKIIGVLVGLLCLSALLIIPACASTPAPASSSNSTSPADAMALAQDALNRMDGGGGSPASQPQQSPSNQQGASSQQQQSVSVATGARPAWVDNVRSAYPDAQFVAAVGHGSTRDVAENTAYSNVASIFRQSIQQDTSITNTYQEAIRSGVVQGWSDDLTVVDNINRSVSMDAMVGTDIRAVWHDTRANVFYAVAAMEKSQASRVYSDMIRANVEMINRLIDMTPAERNSLEGFSRYQFAATVADVNENYAGVLNILGAPPVPGVVSGAQYRITANDIVKAIPIFISVPNDRARRIHGAFNRAMTDPALGFRTGGNNSRYVLNVTVDVSEVVIANNANQWARMVLHAELVDTQYDIVLFPWGFNLREGHTTLSEAENRTFLQAERRIGAEYKDLVVKFLSEMMPVR